MSARIAAPSRQIIAAMVLIVCLPPGITAARADKKKPGNLVIQFLTEPSIAELSLPVEPFSAWLRPVVAGLEERFENEKEGRDVVVQVVVHPKGPPDIAVAGQPALSKEQTKAVVDIVSAVKGPQAKVADVPFRLRLKIKGGFPGKDPELIPPLEAPNERRLRELDQAKPADRLALLRRWARDEALPVLAAFAVRAEPQFEGVRNMGKMLNGLDATQAIDVDKLTLRNPDYWRAMVEMSPGLQQVPMIRLALLIANGEIDRARRLAFAVGMFDSGASGPSWIRGECQALMSRFFEDIDRKIGEGIKLHDQGHYKEALAIYDAVVKDYPNSALARYERFQTLRASATASNKAVGPASPDWPTAAKTIYRCDPLFPNAAQASSAQGIYQVYLRTQINKLFKNRETASKDAIQYADIALDLGDPGLAALIYWNALVTAAPKDYAPRTRDDMLEYFLYALERLDITKLKESFEGDHKAAFARIAAERLKVRDASPVAPIFRKFRDQETPAEKKQ